MRVLITGGSGLIGRALTAELVGAGHQVVVLSRRPGEVEGLPAGARAAGWDGETAEGWVGELSQAGALVHLAGENIASGRWSEARKRRLWDSRVVSGEAVAEAYRRADPRPGILIQGSAVGYYGPRGDEEVTEETPPGDDFLARLGVAWEAATAAVEDLGIRRAIARTGIVLSTRGGALPKMALPFKLFVGGRVGGGRQWFPWIHLADEAAALRFLIDNPAARGPFNLTAPEPVRSRELARALGRALRRPSLFPVPAFALRLALGELADSLLTGQRAVPRRLLELGYSFRFSRVDAALRDLLD